MDTFDKALQINPRYAEAYFNKGLNKTNNRSATL